MSDAWKIRIAISVGLLVLVVPAVTILHMSDSAFRDGCRAQCAPYGLTYRVRTIGHQGASGELRFPADCHCIRPSERTVVEKLRDLIS